MASKQIPRNVKIGMALSSVWLVVEIGIWCSLTLWDSDYYRFGPSGTLILPFVNIKIDTWWKWTLMIGHTMVSTMFGVISADFCYPWIHGTVLNPGVKMEYTRAHALLATNGVFALSEVSRLLFFMAAYSQVDIAIASVLSATVAAAYSSHRVIYDDHRNADKPADDKNNMSSDHVEIDIIEDDQDGETSELRMLSI